ncbi:hypothetical protein FRC14_003985 [Serendipita sp. 396]|nr:hypothetical protein FRC14_003985 [Serendipita sp. 396]KAG8799734.1 hypothetical protein FRC16_004488 [Serendipita sp. 398]
MTSSTYTALSSFTTTTIAPLSTANGTQNANVLLPNGNGAPAALANTAAANNPPQPPPPPQAEPKPNLVVNWNGPGGYVSPFPVPARADSNPPHTSIDPFPDIA